MDRLLLDADNVEVQGWPLATDQLSIINQFIERNNEIFKWNEQWVNVGWLSVIFIPSTFGVPTNNREEEKKVQRFGRIASIGHSKSFSKLFMFLLSKLLPFSMGIPMRKNTTRTKLAITFLRVTYSPRSALLSYTTTGLHHLHSKSHYSLDSH